MASGAAQHAGDCQRDGRKLSRKQPHVASDRVLTNALCRRLTQATTNRKTPASVPKARCKSAEMSPKRCRWEPVPLRTRRDRGLSQASRQTGFSRLHSFFAPRYLDARQGVIEIANGHPLSRSRESRLLHTDASVSRAWLFIGDPGVHYAPRAFRRGFSGGSVATPEVFEIESITRGRIISP